MRELKSSRAKIRHLETLAKSMRLQLSGVLESQLSLIGRVDALEAAGKARELAREHSRRAGRGGDALNAPWQSANGTMAGTGLDATPVASYAVYVEALIRSL